MYQRVIEQYGNKVAALPAGEQDVDRSGDFVLYVDDRWYCHRVIAKLPPEAREIYRKRVDGMAERWYRQGEKRRAIWRRCGGWSTRRSAAPGATTRSSCWVIWRFRTAGSARPWRHTAGSWRIGPRIPFTLVHPDPSVDLARVAAKKLLCRAAAGENPPGPADLKDLASALSRERPVSWPAERGLTPRSWPSRSSRIISARRSEPDNRWPTFAGSFQRTKLVPGPIDVGSMQWRVDLEKVSFGRMPGVQPRGGLGGRSGHGPAGTPAGVSPDRARRAGDRLRRVSGAGLQPE